MLEVGLHTEWISYGNDGKYSGFLARPEHLTGPLPAVVVIQEIWGVEKHIQEVAVRFAGAGYIVIAPDLFAVDGVKPEHLSDERVAMAKAFYDTLPPGSGGNAEIRDAALSKLPEAESSKISATLQGVLSGHDIPRYLGNLKAAADYLHHDCPHSQGRKVGSVGFCMGGMLSQGLASVDPELAAAVIFYGRAMPEDQLAGIQCPVLGFYGGRDHGVTDGVPALAETMKKLGKSFEPHIYEDAPHAFFNDTRSSFRQEPSRDAFAKTIGFFNQQLS
jgi:carboxymethylenebutenolidase